MSGDASAINPLEFRRVLGQFPTGVAVITAAGSADSGPAGMVVSSFTSVSLDPPLVGFLPAASSTSWPRIEQAGAFCVNVLAADQEDVCRRFASSDVDKFAGLDYELGPGGAPVITGAVARIHCRIDSVTPTGDHFMVIGSVDQLELGESSTPLVFHQGGYGRFAAGSLVAPDDRGQLTQQLRYLDLIRGELESLADDLRCRATVTARVNGELVIIGQAGSGRTSGGTLVGQQLPYVPSTGAVFAAWDDDAEVCPWLKRTTSADDRDRHLRALRVIRQRGYSLSIDSDEQRAFAAALRDASQSYDTAPPRDLRQITAQLTYDPDELTDDTRVAIRQISAPVFDATGRVALAFTVFEYGRPQPSIDAYFDRVRLAGQRSTSLIGGSAPQSERAPSERQRV